jgi:ribose transport system permease protein
MGAESTRARLRVPNEIGILAVLLLVVIAFSVFSPNFLTVGNVLSLLLNGAVIAFLTLGQTLVLLIGGIDLSTGAVIAMTGVVSALLMAYGVTWWLAVTLTLLLGAATGAINGILIYFGRIPAFIVTFAMMGVASAVPLILTGAGSVTVLQQEFAFIGQARIFGIPFPVILLALVALLLSFLLARTTFGVHLYAMGGSLEAGRLAGIRIARNTVIVYAMSGLLAAVGGLIITSRLMVGYPNAGLGNELFYSIAGAVVGGVSLFGGVGTIGGAIIGATLIAVVSNGLNVLNVSSYWQSLVVGLIILVGVFFDVNRARLAGTPIVARLVRRRPKDSIPAQESATKEKE